MSGLKCGNFYSLSICCPLTSLRTSSTVQNWIKQQTIFPKISDCCRFTHLSIRHTRYRVYKRPLQHMPHNCNVHDLILLPLFPFCLSAFNWSKINCQQIIKKERNLRHYHFHSQSLSLKYYKQSSLLWIIPNYRSDTVPGQT